MDPKKYPIDVFQFDGEISVGRSIGMYAWHGKHHLAHITSVLDN